MDNSKVDISKPVFALFTSLSNHLYVTLYGPSKRVLISETYALQGMFGDGIKKDQSTDKVYHVVAFLNYLHLEGVILSSVSDKHIENYRDSLSLENGISRKKSINVYLTTIYNFIANYYEGDMVKLASLIGCSKEYRVKSGLYNENRTRVSRNREVKLYPLKFSVPSSKGLSGLRQDQIPTESDFIQLINFIENSGSNAFIIQRDKLIVETARSSAFRRGSIHSLLASQFRDISQAEEHGTITIRPAKQKFSYESSFEIEFSLALKINLFITATLDPYLKKIKCSNTWTGHLFINKDGTEMTKLYMTQRISIYAKKLGWPPGKVLHAFRHLFAIEETEAEYSKQLELTNDPTVARSSARIHLKDKLGHMSKDSQETYLEHAHALNSEDIDEKEKEIERMRITRQARLEQELIMLKTGGKISDFDI